MFQFHKPGLFSAYASYMDNFNPALEIVLDARAARPAFSKLLDVSLRREFARSEFSESVCGMGLRNGSAE